MRSISAICARVRADLPITEEERYALSAYIQACERKGEWIDRALATVAVAILLSGVALLAILAWKTAL